jgi:hypothetical protein
MDLEEKWRKVEQGREEALLGEPLGHSRAHKAS